MKHSATMSRPANFGCFLCPEAVKAAEALGLVSFKWGNYNGYKCYLTQKKMGNYMVEIKGGSQPQVMRNIAVKMLELNSK